MTDQLNKGFPVQLIYIIETWSQPYMSKLKQIEDLSWIRGQTM